VSEDGGREEDGEGWKRRRRRVLLRAMASAPSYLPTLFPLPD